MNPHFEVERVSRAFDIVRSELLAERTVGGHWVGELGSSPSATAAAISALVLAHANGADELIAGQSHGNQDAGCENLLRGDLSELIVESLHWLAERQNSDGGWSDTLRGRSSVAATVLVQSAFRLTCVPAKYVGLIDRADEYLEAHGGAVSLRKRFERDKSMNAPVMANAALAGMLTWRQVPALPFEAALLPSDWLRRLHPPVASFAMPLLIAVGQLKFHHDPPRNPFRRLARAAARQRTLAVLERFQAGDGSFLESVPITAFVVMSLAGMGLDEHRIVERGVEFLLATVRSDASWATDANLVTSNTARAINVLAGKSGVASATRRIKEKHLSLAWSDTERADDTVVESDAVHVDQLDENCIDWLLDAQHFDTISARGEKIGGWSSTDLSGGVPNTDDTAEVLLALAAWRGRYPHLKQHRLRLAAQCGVEWLLALQNDDGGWPASCRGWSGSRSDASAADLTAHAIQALHAWQHIWNEERPTYSTVDISTAIERGLHFLENEQRNDGSFVPLALGNQHQPDGYNLVYGTAEVIAMCAELGELDSEMAQRAARWLIGVQHANGGWGPPRKSPATSASNIYRTSSSRAEDALAGHCSVEESALAVGALLPMIGANQLYARAVQNGLKWLVEAVEQGRINQPAPLGRRFGKLWYAERLYPLMFATSALGQAMRQLSPRRSIVAPVA